MGLSFAEVHDWLMSASSAGDCDAFDAHVLASIVAIGLQDAQARGCAVSETLGLGGRRLRRLIGSRFPAADGVFSRFETLEEPALPLEEADLRQLLEGASDGSEFGRDLASMVARRSMAPNHLWQDLGLRSRRELGWLMERHFVPLHRRNILDMKWKKFFYRAICRDDGFRLCTTPVCTECDDFDACFGEESGDSLLARVRRDMP